MRLRRYREGVCVSANMVLCSVPETGGVGSVGCSTDRCLNTAYLSEVDEVEELETGVSMAGML